MNQPSFALHRLSDVQAMATALQCPEDPEKAERIFRAILHTLRDCLPSDNAIRVLRLLPDPLKAIYVQNWQTLASCTDALSMPQFIRRVRESAGKIAFYDFPTEAVTERYIREVYGYVEQQLPVKKRYVWKASIPFLAAFSKPASQVNPFTTIYTSRN